MWIIGHTRRQATRAVRGCHHTGQACFSIACNLIACLECFPPDPGELVTCSFPRIRILCTHSTANKTPPPHSTLPTPRPLLPKSSVLSFPPFITTTITQLSAATSSAKTLATCDHVRCHCRLPSPSSSPLRLLCDASQSQCLITTGSNTQHFPLPRTIQAFHAAVPRSCTSALAIFFKRLDTFLECRKHCSTPFIQQ